MMVLPLVVKASIRITEKVNKAALVMMIRRLAVRPLVGGVQANLEPKAQLDCLLISKTIQKTLMPL